MAKKRRSGNPKKHNAGGRTTPKAAAAPCKRRSNRPCKFTSSMKAGDGPKVVLCSWCGRRQDGRHWATRAAPSIVPEEVPEDWFSSEEPVCALPIPEWKRAHRGVHTWPVEAQQALAAQLL
jgi:hypothetical protein